MNDFLSDAAENPRAANIAAAERVRAAVAAGVRDALIMHKKLGNPIVVWEDGKVRWIPADEITIPEEPTRPLMEGLQGH